MTPSRDGGMPPGELFGLSGTWALRVDSATWVDNPYVGQAIVNSYVLGISELHHLDDRVEIATRICRVESEPYGEMTTTFGPGFIGAIPVVQTVADPVLAEAGQPFEPTLRITLIGWVADQAPTDDMLPTDDEDPRVYDADGDGNPGVTLSVSGALNGDLYVVQRSTVRLEGTVESMDRIAGTSRTEIERNTLGATNPVLRAGETTRTPHPNPERSPFEMVRMPFGAGCDDIETMFDARQR